MRCKYNETDWNEQELIKSQESSINCNAAYIWFHESYLFDGVDAHHCSRISMIDLSESVTYTQISSIMNTWAMLLLNFKLYNSLLLLFESDYSKNVFHYFVRPIINKSIIIIGSDHTIHTVGPNFYIDCYSMDVG